MSRDLAALCASHGIEPTFIDMNGVERSVPEETLTALAAAFGIDSRVRHSPPDIVQAGAETAPSECYVPEGLRDARVWGLTCQLPSLASARNLGMGDFADASTLCRTAAAEGADFLGLNPLHALFWSDPTRVSPFYPSNRRLLNPLYIAVDWIEGFAGLSPEEQSEADRLRQTALIDVAGVMRLKDRLLRRLYQRFPWDDRHRDAYASFCADGGDSLAAHALFEAISETMTAGGTGAGWPAWPAPLQDRRTAEVASFAAANRDRIDYHLWLQWLADRQLARVQRDARDAGMRIGLYIDFAVGTAPDGSATWTDPDLAIPGVSIGAPPDPFSAVGQDWGLAPLSPIRLADADCQPFADTLAAVLRHAGAARIDHAMSLARLWLIPRGATGKEGAYVRYPLSRLLARTAEESRRARAIMVGEDLGVVPEGFRALMAQHRIHSYKVLFFEQGPAGFHPPRDWPVDALACVATHDMPTFAGWSVGADIALRRQLGRLPEEADHAAQSTRRAEREALLRLLDGPVPPDELSPRLHAVVAASPCRLVALQAEDALGMTDQVNLPGTIDEHPNWRHRLPVAVDRIADSPGFRAHAAAMRAARPR